MHEIRSAPSCQQHTSSNQVHCQSYQHLHRTPLIQVSSTHPLPVHFSHILFAQRAERNPCCR